MNSCVGSHSMEEKYYEYPYSLVVYGKRVRGFSPKNQNVPRSYLPSDCNLRHSYLTQSRFESWHAWSSIAASICRLAHKRLQRILSIHDNFSSLWALTRVSDLTQLPGLALDRWTLFPPYRSFAHICHYPWFSSCSWCPELICARAIGSVVLMPSLYWGGCLHYY